MKRIVKAPQDLNSLLEQASGSIANLSAKSQSLNLLSDIVRQICPDLPENAWQIANFRENLVIIEVISPVWSQRLQFERNNICQQLLQHSDGIFTNIEIKVNPYWNRKEKPVEKPKARKHMSEKSAEQINEIAQNAPPGLKEKLLRLAKHANKK
ncbi:DUF721 domain-containing protein [Thalassotalea crassostreae]|uniref:DUF721 domain-containing protein n=1 Tax=Thalassotalea crassostreae TaxID=1763536 RepID=UPI000838FED6|nr:DciA family protein [Thalassotalea crassostreae]